MADADDTPYSSDGSDRFHDECGVFGIFGRPDAAAIVTLGLHALQHRGQEAAGIVSYDGSQFHVERHIGLIGDTFTKRAVMDRLLGSRAIGHTRYATTGGSGLRNVQPFFAELADGGLAGVGEGLYAKFLRMGPVIGMKGFKDGVEIMEAVGPDRREGWTRGQDHPRGVDDHVALGGVFQHLRHPAVFALLPDHYSRASNRGVETLEEQVGIHLTAGDVVSVGLQIVVGAPAESLQAACVVTDGDGHDDDGVDVEGSDASHQVEFVIGRDHYQRADSAVVADGGDQLVGFRATDHLVDQRVAAL